MLVFEKNEEASAYQGPSRLGFTFTFIRPLNSYALFGGATADNDIYLFSISNGTWAHQPTGGTKKPPSRKFHGAAFIQAVSCLLINGGQDDKCHCLEDFFVLSIKDWKWRKLTIVKCPQPRSRHCIIPKTERELILFGGVSHYNESTNDIWLMKAQYEREGKQDSIGLQCIKIDPKGKLVPQGKILAQSTFYRGERFFAGSLDKNGLLRVFCFEFRHNQWRELQLGLRCTHARMFRAVRGDEESFVLSLSQADKRKNAPGRFFYFDSSNGRFKSLQEAADLANNCDEMSGEGGEAQIMCLRQGKRIFTAKYGILRAQQPQSSIQDYLIAIKHEQILSQELARKNSQLQQLYRQMQNYITQLHKQYVRFEEDSRIEEQRSNHIEDCHMLKREYARLDRLYDSASEQVRALRSQLGTINEDFERCMETQFDEQA